jgi:hypothetical protein
MNNPVFEESSTASVLSLEGIRSGNISINQGSLACGSSFVSMGKQAVPFPHVPVSSVVQLNTYRLHTN